MTTGRLRVRPGTREDTPGIVALLNETFRTPINAAIWEWYAFANPSGPSRISVGLEPDNDSIAGMVAFSPFIMRFEGAPIQSDYADHLAVRAAYRDTFSYIALMMAAHRWQVELGLKVGIVAS